MLQNPIHTDLAIPVDADLLRDFGFVRDAGVDLDLPGVRYLVLGWGGRAFYTQTPTWSDLKAMPALKGLTIDRSVMHVDLAGDIAVDGDNVLEVRVSDNGRRQLLRFIRDSFEEGANGPVPIPGVAYGRYDAFFEANGYFTSFLGCNTWTAAALRQAGISTGWWTPLPAPLAWSLRLHNSEAAVPAPSISP